MTAVIVDQPRRSTWDLVIDHVEGRRSAMPAVVVDLVIADMRSRDEISRYGDNLVDAYWKALDFAAYLTVYLDDYGVSFDDPIDVRAPNSSRLVHVQSMLWDHIRTIVQLRGLIEERAS